MGEGEIGSTADHATWSTSDAQPPSPSPGWPRCALWITLGAAALLAVVLAYQALRLGSLHAQNEIDDGVYYGEGVMLTHGILPYHAYLDVQPPGIALLMAPFAFVGRFIGNRVAYEAARAFVAAVGVANVLLVGRLLRRRPPVGVLAGVVVLGFFTCSLTAEHTILLEPFLVFATLLSFLLVFDDTDTATSSRIRWLAAGGVLGLATGVKLWAILPVLVLMVVAARRGRGLLVRFVVGTACGVGVVCAPFFLLAPVAFFRDVVLVQLDRSHFGQIEEKYRLWSLLGVPGPGHFTLSLSLLVPVAIWILLALLVGALIAFTRSANREGPLSDLDACALACVVIVGVSFLLSTEYDPHYGGFFAPFFAVAMSGVAVRLASLALPALTVAVAIVVVGYAAVSIGDVARQKAAPAATSLTGLFPSSACVLSQDYSPLLLSNRYNLFVAGCPRVLDIFGTELAAGHGIGGFAYDAGIAKIQSNWLGWLRRVDGVVLTVSAKTKPDFGPTVRSYVLSHFSLVNSSQSLYVYRRK